MDLNTLWQQLAQGEGTGFLVAQVFLVVFFSLLIDFVQKRVVRRLHRAATASRPFWDEALLEAAERPFSALIWIVGIAFAAEIVGRSTHATIFSAVGPARSVGVIACLTWFLIRAIRGMEQNIVAHRQARGEAVDMTTVDAVGKLLRASVIITSILIALQTLGFSVSGVLAFGGIGGIAIGFAAKDLLANFFGGLMVYLDRPFAVGDWIRSPDRDIEGTVEKIGWRLTCIRTFDKRPLYVPNSVFANIAVQNPSRMSHRRIYETIGLRYEDIGRMAAIVARVRELLENHPDIDASQTLMVNFTTFSSSSIDFFIYTFTRTTNWVEYHAVKERRARA